MFRLQGRAGPRDREKSATWLTAAAKLGHPLAAFDLALLYIMIALLVFWKHRANIERLLKGIEPRVGRRR